MIELIAEISGAHGGSLSNALALIKAAKDAGATGIKLQCFDPARLAVRRVKHTRIPALMPMTGAMSVDIPALTDLYLKTHTPQEWFHALISAANWNGLTWHASVFDPEDVAFLETLDCPRYKIASFEARDGELLNTVGQTDKDVIVSVNQNDEIPFGWHDSIITLNDFMGRGELTILHATDYGVTARMANLSKMRSIASEADNKLHGWGLSDHTTGILASRAAVTLGATMIEWHIKLPGVHTPDDAFAWEPEAFRLRVDCVRQIEEAMNG